MSSRHSDPLAPRRPPSQRRAHVLVAAVREAARRILASEGPDALTTNRVADLAGVSVGSLYHYYPNKESIVADLFEERLRELIQEIDGLAGHLSLEQLPVDEALLRFVSMMLQHRERFRDLHRAFYRDWGHRFAVADRVAPDGHTYLEITLRSLRELIELHRDDVEVDDPEVAARTLVVLAEGAARAIGAGQLSDVPFERLCGDVTRALLGYLRFRPQPPAR